MIRKNLSLVFILIIIGIIAVSYVLLAGWNKNTKTVSNLFSLTPTPIPFYSLTIPYLRARTYISSLDGLEQVSQYQDYTSYLTSYNSDGLKINGLLTKPTGIVPAGGWPAIVFVHGYIPPKQYQTLGAAYSAYVDYLARNGFVVFKINLRGNGDSEGTGGGAYYSSDYIIDTLNAYSALQNASFVNPKKIGLWGHSMAGNVVMRSFAAKPTIPAVVIWAGAGYTYTDLSEFGIHDSSYQPRPTISGQQNRSKGARQIYGDPKNGNPFWKQVAPTNYLNDLKGAIQIHHAVDDETVNIAYSRNLNKLLNQTSVIHELDEYDSGGHNISGASFDLAMQRTVAFFKKYLEAQ